MNKEIYILGIGHNTSVYIDLVEACGYEIKGLYHYNGDRTGDIEHGYRVLGSFDDLFSRPSLVGMNLALSQGDNAIRSQLFDKILQKGGGGAFSHSSNSPSFQICTIRQRSSHSYKYCSTSRCYHRR